MFGRPKFSFGEHKVRQKMKYGFRLLFLLPTSAFGRDTNDDGSGPICSPNEDVGRRNKRRNRGVSTRFGPRTIEKSIENPHLIFCSSFQKFCLGGVNFMLPKRRFWKAERTVQKAFSKNFSRARVCKTQLQRHKMKMWIACLCVSRTLTVMLS